MPGWPAHLASMTMVMSNVYVMQSTVSQASLLHDGFLEGLRYAGPALFSVYTGTPDHHPGLPVYLNSAAALESRVFPAFAFNPGRGDTIAERIDIGDNPQLDRDWPVESLTYRTSEGEEVTVQVPMTVADLLLCDTRIGRHFWHVPAPKWHPDMVPLGEYLQLDPDAGAGKVPYLTTVDGKGQLGRAIITRAVLLSVLRCMSSWRHLQESGGVRNSFAENALSQEKQRLEDDKLREVAAIEEKYRLELDRDIEELTREIVQRIAAQLLAEGGDISKVAFAAPPPPPAAEASAPAAPAEPLEKKAEAEEEEEEEEESLSFDDPYIDTPLCTTCNDCTNLNGQMFAYNDNKQAYIKDPLAGPYRDLVVAAEKCPVNIIHPGKPKNADEPDLDDLLKRAAQYL
jgi:ferredoxin